MTCIEPTERLSRQGHVEALAESGDGVLIPVGGGRWVALVDEADVERASAHRWGITCGYVQSYSAGALHRFVLEAGRKKVDHKNGNGYDNRRSNLRVASTSQNAQNMRSRRGSSSQFKGVMWEKDRSLWVARIKVDGRYLNLGRFSREADAAAAYDRAATEHFGEFARLNLEVEA